MCTYIIVSTKLVVSENLIPYFLGTPLHTE